MVNRIGPSGKQYFACKTRPVLYGHLGIQLISEPTKSYSPLLGYYVSLRRRNRKLALCGALDVIRLCLARLDNLDNVVGDNESEDSDLKHPSDDECLCGQSCTADYELRCLVEHFVRGWVMNNASDSIGQDGRVKGYEVADEDKKELHSVHDRCNVHFLLLKIM